jgi:hypothetical protein
MTIDDDLHRLRQAWKYAASEARRTFWIDILREQGMRGESDILMTSQVNSRDGSPAVLFRWGEQNLLMDSATAKRHAMAVLETAMGADTDAFLFYWLKHFIGAEPEKAAMVLQDFRRWREEESRRQAAGEA